MTSAQLITLLVLAAVVAALIWDKMRADVVALAGAAFLLMTGVVRPRYFAQFQYTFDLLLGKKGFLTHNLPLLLAGTAGLLVLKRPGRDRLELLALFVWCVVGWLLYGVLSKNHGGHCVSIRWFAPFLAPGFWLLANARAALEASAFMRQPGRSTTMIGTMVKISRQRAQ